MNKTIEEVLYPAMEDFALDLVVGKGPIRLGTSFQASGMDLGFITYTLGQLRNVNFQ